MERRNNTRQGRWRSKPNQQRKNAQNAKKIAQIIECLLIFLVATVIWYCTLPTDKPMQPDEMRVYMLDVGQGDAFLIRTASCNVLLDGGESDNGDRLVRMLHAIGVQKLDYIINSHPHYDHFGGLITVLAEMPVGTLYLCDVPDALMPTSAYFFDFMDAMEASDATVRIPQCGDTLVLDDAVLTFLSVDNSAYTDLNDCSLLCRIDHNEISFLFCGDLSAKSEREFVRQGLIQPVDVLKCAHHGSNSSSCDAFLAAAQPQCVMIPVGTENDYGHPSVQCLKRIGAYTDQVFRTDTDGDVMFSSDGTKLMVTIHYQADEDRKEAG